MKTDAYSIHAVGFKGPSGGSGKVLELVVPEHAMQLEVGLSRDQLAQATDSGTDLMPFAKKIARRLAEHYTSRARHEGWDREVGPDAVALYPSHMSELAGLFARIAELDEPTWPRMIRTCRITTCG